LGHLSQDEKTCFLTPYFLYPSQIACPLFIEEPDLLLSFNPDYTAQVMVLVSGKENIGGIDLWSLDKKSVRGQVLL
jgi:hypothetical protein